MLATIKSIRYKHIQSLDDVFIDDLPPVGIITFVGENSEGKSIFTKVVEDVISATISQKRNRDALISWWSDWGECEITRHDGVALLIHLDRESSNTYVKYTDPNTEEEYVRTAKDNEYADLVRLFGFHWNPQRELSLNFYATFDPLLFVKTSPSANYSILAECTGDPKLEKSIDTQKSYKQLLDYKKNELLSEQMALQSEASALRVYNIANEAKHAEMFETAASEIEILVKCVELPQMRAVKKAPDICIDDLVILVKSIKGLPKVKTPSKMPEVDEKPIMVLGSCVKKLPMVKLPKATPTISKDLEKLKELVGLTLDKVVEVRGSNWRKAQEDLETILGEKCPTCGRELLTE